MRVLYHLSHHSSSKPDGWSGAPGEAVWVQDLVARIKAKAALRGIEVTTVDGDLLDHPVFHTDYDAFIAPHYEANVHGTGGYFTGRALASTTPNEDDRLGGIFRQRYEALAGHPPLHMEWSNPNVTDYYGFRLTSAKTPGFLIEHGVGWNLPADYDYTWLRSNIDAIADVHVATLAEFGGLVPVTDPRFAVLATSKPTAAQMRQYCPTAPDGVPELYAALASVVGIRAEIAFAQAVKETGRFTFLLPDGSKPPSGCDATWFNPAGLGVTGPFGVGNRFPNWESGIRAHLGHLLWYFGPTHPVVGFCDVDQRHWGNHKGFANDIRKLNGQWNGDPTKPYGESIANIADAILAAPSTAPDPFWNHDDNQLVTWRDLKAFAARTK